MTHSCHRNRLRVTGGFSTINAAAYPSAASNSYIFQRAASVWSASTFSKAGATSGARDTVNPSNGYETPTPIALIYDSLRDQQLKKASVLRLIGAAFNASNSSLEKKRSAT